MRLLACLFACFLALPLFAQTFEQRPKVPLDVALPLLVPLKPDAIVLGTGPTDIYVFIDPFCPRSRDFVSMIFDSEKMRGRYTYYFFLYRLERFDSSVLIESIYRSDRPLERMREIMVGDAKAGITLWLPENIKAKIERIAEVGRKLDVYKRPYLFIDKKAKETR